MALYRKGQFNRRGPIFKDAEGGNSATSRWRGDSDQLGPSQTPSLGICCPWYCSGVPSPCGPCSHSSCRLFGARTQSQVLCQQSRAVLGASPRSLTADLGPPTPDARESHLEPYISVCVYFTFSFFLSSLSGPLVTFNLS